MTDPNEQRSNDELRAVYVISVAAEIAGMHPQTLRIYERKGLLEPARTTGGSRRYSEADIAMLTRIAQLTDEGLNLAGVKRVLELEARIAELEDEVHRTRAATDAAVDEAHRSHRRDLVPLRQALSPFDEAARVLRRLTDRG